MNTKILYKIMILAALFFAASAMATYDVIIVDPGNSEITRMDIEGNIVWQNPLGNADVDSVTGPDGNIYVADNTNRRVRVVAAWSGEVSAFFADGFRCVALAFGPDYNGDGTSDLFVAGEGRIAVVGGPGSGNAGKLLASSTEILSDNQVSITFGPDETGDGNPELYVVDGAANKVFVVDGTDLTNILRDFDVNIRLVQGAQIIGDKLYYSDANTQNRNFVAYYNIDGSSTGVSRVLEHPEVAYPRYLAVAPDGKIYIPNRQATTYNEIPSVDVYDSNWNRIKTIYTKEGANFASVTFVPVDTGFKEFIVADGNENNKLYKYNQYGDMIWEAEGNFRNTRSLVMGPDGNLYTFSGGPNDHLIRQVNPVDGSQLQIFYNPGSPNRCYDGAFAYDYNQNGYLDLYALVGDGGFSTLKVIGGPGSPEAGQLLAELPNIRAQHIAVGPDVAGPATQQDPNTPDGIAELYVGQIGNGSTTPRGLYIIEPSTLRIVKAYDSQAPDPNPVTQANQIRRLQFGPDGYLYGNHHSWSRIVRWEIISDNGDIKIEPVGNWVQDRDILERVSMPSGFDFAFDRLFVANRRMLNVNAPPGVVSVIKADASGEGFLDTDSYPNGVFATMPGEGRADAILVIDALGCPVDLPADLNGDCFVDAADLAIFAKDWLLCTDPVIENCP